MVKIDLSLDAYEVCSEALNRQFDELTEEAKRIASSFLDFGVERNVLVPIMITVNQDKRHRSTSIRWSKVRPASARSSRRVAITAIAKGQNTDKYPASAFRFLEPDVRARVMLYEEMLSVIRCSLSRNREAHKYLANTRIRVEHRAAAINLGSADGMST